MMKIGKWFAVLATSPKVANIAFQGTNEAGNRAEGAVVTLKEGFEAKNGSSEAFFNLAHDARLFIQGAKSPKADKPIAAIPAVEAERTAEEIEADVAALIGIAKQSGFTVLEGKDYSSLSGAKRGANRAGFDGEIVQLDNGRFAFAA